MARETQYHKYLKFSYITLSSQCPSFKKYQLAFLQNWEDEKITWVKGEDQPNNMIKRKEWLTLLDTKIPLNHSNQAICNWNSKRSTELEPARNRLTHILQECGERMNQNTGYPYEKKWVHNSDHILKIHRWYQGT